MEGKVISIASGKGGNGKTSAAVNIGTALAIAGKNTILIDLNPGFRNLDLCLGMQNCIVYDLEDVLSGTCRVKQAINKIEFMDGLSIISSSQLRGKEGFEKTRFRNLIGILKRNFDYIVIDTPAGTSAMSAAAYKASDKIVVVATPEYASIRANGTLCNDLKSMTDGEICILLNRVRPEFLETDFCPSLREAASSLDGRLVGIVQEDDSIYLSVNSGIPIVMHRGIYAGINYINIAERLREA